MSAPVTVRAYNGPRLQRSAPITVRAYNGRNSRWYQAAIRQKGGCIAAAGLAKEVVFEPADATLNQRIDEAYRRKYAGSPYLAPMIGERARAATIRIIPKE